MLTNFFYLNYLLWRISHYELMIMDNSENSNSKYSLNNRIVITKPQAEHVTKPDDAATKLQNDNNPYLKEINELKLELKNVKLELNKLKSSNKAEFNDSPIAMLTINYIGIIKHINLLAESLLGIDRQNIINENFQKFIYPNDIDNFFNLLQSIISNKALPEYKEIRLRRHDGVIINCILYTYPNYYKNGEIDHITFYLIDISNKVSTESQLKDSENKFHTLVDNSPFGILISDLKGNILEINRKLLDILNSESLEETISINVLHFPLLINSGISSDFHKVISNGNKLQAERIYTSRWGKKTYMKYTLCPIKYANNEAFSIMCIVEDLSNSKNLLSSLITSENRFRTLATNISNTDVIVLDTNLKIIFADGEDLFTKGIHHSSLEGNSLKDIFDPQTYKNIEQNFKSALRGEYNDFELKYSNSLYEIKIIPVKDFHESINSIIAISINISNRLLYESEISSLKIENQKIRDNISNFYNNISYKVRYPINLIFEYSKYLNTNADIDKESYDHNLIKNVYHSAYELKSFCNAMLELNDNFSTLFNNQTEEILINDLISELKWCSNLYSVNNVQVVSSLPQTTIQSFRISRYYLVNIFKRLLEYSLNRININNLLLKIDYTKNDEFSCSLSFYFIIENIFEINFDHFIIEKPEKISSNFDTVSKISNLCNKINIQFDINQLNKNSIQFKLISHNIAYKIYTEQLDDTLQLSACLITNNKSTENTLELYSKIFNIHIIHQTYSKNINFASIQADIIFLDISNEDEGTALDILQELRLNVFTHKAYIIAFIDMQNQIKSAYDLEAFDDFMIKPLERNNFVEKLNIYKLKKP